MKNVQTGTLYTITEADQPHLLREILWTAKAISKDLSRPGMMLLRVTNDELTATDGRRLHLSKLPTGLPPGLYRPITLKRKVAEIVSVETKDLFPKTSQAFPRKTTLAQRTPIEDLGGAGRALGVSISYFKIARSIPVEYGLNFGFLEDVMADGAVWEFLPPTEDENKASSHKGEIYLRSHVADVKIQIGDEAATEFTIDRVALLMPLSMGKV